MNNIIWICIQNERIFVNIRTEHVHGTTIVHKKGKYVKYQTEY